MIDVRGLSCPMPVVMVQKEIKGTQPAALDVLADNPVAKENVIRYAQGQGYEAAVEEANGEFTIHLTK